MWATWQANNAQQLWSLPEYWKFDCCWSSIRKCTAAIPMSWHSRRDCTSVLDWNWVNTDWSASSKRKKKINIRIEQALLVLRVPCDRCRVRNSSECDHDDLGATIKWYRLWAQQRPMFATNERVCLSRYCCLPKCVRRTRGNRRSAPNYLRPRSNIGATLRWPSHRLSIICHRPIWPKLQVQRLTTKFGMIS